MSSATKTRFAWVPVLIVAALVYLNSLSNPFVIDDRIVIFSNVAAVGDWTARDVFGRDLFGDTHTGYFRPLTLATFVLNFSFAQDSPAGYRAVNIVLHVAVTALVMFLFFLVADRWVAILGGLIFSVHPVHVQAVAYISSRGELLFTLFGLMSLVCWHLSHGAECRWKWIWRASGFASFFVGLFAKETMIVFLVLVIAMDFALFRGVSYLRWVRENIAWYVGFTGLFILYLGIRHWEGFPLILESGLKLDFTARLLFALKLFALNFGLLFYPADLALFRVVPLPTTFFEWQVFSGVGLILCLSAVTFVFWRIERCVSFGVLWFVVSVLPALNLTLLNAPMMEHWLYLPSIGLTLAFVGTVHWIGKRVGDLQRATVALCLLALILSSRTFVRNFEWGDLVTVFSRNVELYPGHAKAWTWLGYGLASSGRYGEAIDAFRVSLKINPTIGGTWIGLGQVLLLAGEEKQAEEVFAAAVSLWPRFQVVVENLKRCCPAANSTPLRSGGRDEAGEE